jgi:hypothetical protein
MARSEAYVVVEFCENGAKAVAWEATAKRRSTFTAGIHWLRAY